VDAELIRGLEELAGLTCDSAERAALLADLRVMVAYVDRLAVFVDGYSAPGTTRREGCLREDRPRPSLTMRDALSGTAASDGAYVLTPPVRERGDR